MMNLLAAAWKLSVYQIWNRKRRWVSLALFLLPLLIVGVSAMLRTTSDDFYREFVPYALGSILVPFVAIYWGSGALSDEIEGKTLVYLWTRPRDRGFLIFAKLAGSWPWLLLLTVLGVAAAYSYEMMGRGQWGDYWQIAFWDVRAIALAAIAWTCLAFLLSIFTKRPLTYALLIAYLWELIPANGPGFLRRLSITQHMFALSTHKPVEKSMLIDRIEITETQALLTLIGLSGLCVVAGIWMANQREYLGDDPARNQ